MVGKRCSLVVALLTLVSVCAVVAPAFSGEHPWDADNQLSGKDHGPSAELWDPLRDTVITAPAADTGVEVPVASSLPSGSALMKVASAVFRLCFDLL